MVRHFAVQAQPAEPAVGQVEVDFLAQAPLGADAEAVPHQQHPDHQLGINRRSPHRAVVRLKVGPNARQIDEPVNRPQHVIARDMPFQAKAVKQRLLHHSPFAHHHPRLLSPVQVNQGLSTTSSSEFFNTIDPKRTFVCKRLARPSHKRKWHQAGMRMLLGAHSTSRTENELLVDWVELRVGLRVGLCC